MTAIKIYPYDYIKNNTKFQMKAEQSQINQYYKLKNECDLPVRLKIYFSILENGMDHQNQHHHHKSHAKFESKNQFSKRLLEAFNNLSL